MINRFFKQLAKSSKPRQIVMPRIKPHVQQNNSYLLALVVFGIWQFEKHKNKQIKDSMERNKERYGQRPGEY